MRPGSTPRKFGKYRHRRSALTCSGTKRKAPSAPLMIFGTWPGARGAATVMSAVRLAVSGNNGKCASPGNVLSHARHAASLADADLEL